MRRKYSTAASFIIIAAVYCLAAAVGIAVYAALPFGYILNLLIADAAATVLVFAFSLIFGNASVYDPYWSVQPIVILLAFALRPEHGLTLAGALLLAVVFLWGIRLTANWAYTFHGLDSQDWRYTMLKEKTGRLYPFVNFTGIHLVPTLVVFGCVLPGVYLIRCGARLNAAGAVCLLASVLAAAMQGAADVEMHAFRRSGRGGFIDTGLWRYSRHPNYLGEIVMWWGVALAAVCMAPFKWYLIAGAVANTLLFLFISIPLADGHQSRKPGFEEYRSRTNMLLPVPRRDAR